MRTAIFLSFLLLTVSLSATVLECRDIYTTITSQQTGEKYTVDGRPGNQTTIFKIVAEEENFYAVGTNSEKVNLNYLGQGIGNIYFYEQTIGGNFNLYSLFKDGTLTISKSYDALGMSKMNVQTIYNCTKE